MKTVIISVTEAARNFSDCVNRAHYANTRFDLVRNGEPVASIVPSRTKRRSGKTQAQMLREALGKFRLGKEEADAWLRDLEAARAGLIPARDKWQS